MLTAALFAQVMQSPRMTPAGPPRSAVATPPAGTPVQATHTLSWVVCPECGAHVASLVGACPYCAAAVPAAIDEAVRRKMCAKWQDLVGDDYVLRELAGCGSASCVFRATDRARGDEVALKVLELPASSGDATFAAIERQVEAARAIADPHAVVPYSVTRRAGAALLAMPFVAGRTLRDIVAAGTTLAFDAVGTILLDVAEALDSAHAVGVVHGGLRPGNVIVDGGGRAHVTDFGLAAALPTSRSAHNAAAAERAAYAAPEQVHGAAVDGRADQYSLAVIAHELLSGRARLGEWTPSGVATIDPVEVATDTPLRPGISAAGNVALRQALAKQPAHRFPTTREFVDALTGKRVVTPEGMPTLHPQLELPRQRRRILLPLVLTLLLFGAGMFFFGPWNVEEGPWTRRAREGMVRDADRRAAAANAAGQSAVGGTSTGPSSGGAASTPIGPAAPAEGPSFIEVTADRAGAVVVVDGRPRGLAPTTVRVSPGSHTVTLRGGGFGGTSRTVTTSAGGTASVNFSATAP